MSETKTQPITLALEISRPSGSIAMSNQNSVVSARGVAPNQRDEDDIVPTIDALAKELLVPPTAIELVVVSIGPGGFTGLRTAASIAKMISLATSAKIISVESAVVAVCSAGLDLGSYLVVSGVKQDSFWLSCVTHTNCGCVCEANLATKDTFATMLQNTSGVFLDSFAPTNLLQMCEECGVVVHTPKPEAKTLLRLGHSLYSQDGFIHPADLLPLYPREPEAVRIWNKKTNST